MCETGLLVSPNAAAGIVAWRPGIINRDESRELVKYMSGRPKVATRTDVLVNSV